MCNNLTAGRHVVHESTRLSVWSVDGTQEAPGLRQQLTNRSGPHLGECCSSVHTAEVGQVADEVELVSYHTQACVLQHAKTCGQRRKRCLFNGRATFSHHNMYSFSTHMATPVLELRFPVASRYSKGLVRSVPMLNSFIIFSALHAPPSLLPLLSKESFTDVNQAASLSC